MKFFSPRLLSVGMAMAAFAPVQAQSLVDLFAAAKDYDASYKAAQSLHEANQAKAAQARAQLLPTSNLSLSSTAAQIDTNPDLKSQNTPMGLRGYRTQVATLSATQPLYRPVNWATYLQSFKSLSQSEAALQVAQQELLLRVSQAYFDVLASQDSLTFVRAQKAAVSEQLASAKRNFEVGTATITDTREAQARFDLVISQEIAAENDLRVKKLALDQLVGIQNTRPNPLRLSVEPKPVTPNQVEAWVEQAEENHPQILNNKLALEISELEIDKARAGHKPTLDLQASYGGTRNDAGTAVQNYGSNVVNTSMALVMNVPIFAGFSTENRIRETVSLQDKARNDLEAARRNAAQATRAAYFGLISGMGQVKALEAAETSSQVALDANKLGYSVGVRINIDVLNSQSQLYQTKRDLAKARYDVLMGGLKLRQANGTLNSAHLDEVNQLLEP
jgi:outer membrane protein